jgi:hypothetical protein
MQKLPDDLRRVLDHSGVPWRIDNGSRHYKLIVADRLAGILPRSLRVRRQNCRWLKNCIAQVRRVIREQQ